ncbi:hypothetical protein BU17DRAFT_60359 [Hysterangium stoloniferum]|nr:hypothetical protein BU17DRAFT_60359 [Hysterangium stoloniferum]
MALLMLSGSQDEIIPSWHMKELWDITKMSGRKNTTWVDFVSGHHNDTCMQRGYWEAESACRKNVKGSSVANTEWLKQASKRKHGMRGKEWLKGLVESSTLESTLENPRGCPDSLEGVKWTMADLAHAFDIKPN